MSTHEADRGDLEGLTPAERKLALAARRMLRGSETPDAVAVARLNAARRRAIASVAQRRHSPWLLAAPAALAAALLAWIVVPGVLPTASAPVNPMSADALEVLADEMEPEFYENLDLYEALDAEA